MTIGLSIIFVILFFVILSGILFGINLRLRKKLTSFRDQIFQLRKTRTDFVANVSHELKTPLTSIKGYTETLRNSKLEDVAQAQNFLQKIEENADRLDALIHDILDLSRLEAADTELHYETIVIKDFLENLREQFSLRLEKKSQSLSLQNSEGSVLADRKLMEQALSNLVGNANRYCQEGAKIEVKVSRLMNEGREMLSFEVQDNGPGVSSDDLPRIFERFYRADKSRNRALGGTGLGLAIVKHIMLSHGGRAEAFLRPEGGLRFRLLLPRQPVVKI